MVTPKLLTFILLVGWATTTQAAIMIDPGPVGSTMFILDAPFSELDGQDLDGSNITLDFVFSDSKFLDVLANYGTSALARIQFQTDSQAGDALPLVTAIDGFLSDENGANILNTTGGQADAVGVNNGDIQLPFNPLNDGFRFYDVHFTFDLPNIAGREITSAKFRLASDDVTFQVGQASVPEPSTLAIFALGGIGIVAGRIRRWRKQNA